MNKHNYSLAIRTGYMFEFDLKSHISNKIDFQLELC